jgi:hypothetical protein
MGWADLIGRVNRVCVASFKEPTKALYSPSGDDFPAQEIDVIFDNGYLPGQVGEAGFVDLGPRVFVVLADLPTDPEADDPNITIGAVVYSVVKTERDGQGGAILRLQKVAA